MTHSGILKTAATLAATTVICAGMAVAATDDATNAYFEEQIQTGTTAQVALDRLKTTYGAENITVSGRPFMSIPPKSLEGQITPIAVKVLGDRKQVKGSIDVMLCPKPEMRAQKKLDFDQFNTAWTQQTIFLSKADYDAALSKHCANAETKALQDIGSETWTKVAGLENDKQAACYYKDETVDRKVRTISFAKDHVNKVAVYLRAVTLQQQTVCVPTSLQKKKAQ